MKIKISLITLALLSLVSSCNKVEEINTISLRRDFEDSVSISDNTNGMETGSWSETLLFDLTKYPDYESNRSRVKDIAIRGFSFKIANYVGSETAILSNTFLSFGNRIISVNQDINLYDANLNGTIYNIGTSEDFNDFVNILKSEGKISITISGNVSETPVTFNINFTANSTITFLAIQ